MNHSLSLNAIKKSIINYMRLENDTKVQELSTRDNFLKLNGKQIIDIYQCIFDNGGRMNKYLSNVMNSTPYLTEFHCDKIICYAKNSIQRQYHIKKARELKKQKCI